MTGANGQYYARRGDMVRTVAKSVFLQEGCSNRDEIRNFFLAYPFTLPDAIINAAFPVAAYQQ